MEIPPSLDSRPLALQLIFMKLIQCIFCLLCTLSPTIVLAQTNIASPQTRIVEAEPFKIKTGSSFVASSSGTTPRGGSVTASITRSRIIGDLQEAEAIITDKYVGNKTPNQSSITRSVLRSMLHSLDPHSNYFDAADWKELLDEQQSGYAGIGTSIETFHEGGSATTFVMSTFAGSPARRGGLRFGDKIVAVNGSSMLGYETDYVREKIRGAAGTTVRITVERNSSGKVETIELRRGIVSQPSIPDYYILRQGVGYINLSEGFTYTTDDEFTNALHELHRLGMTSLIVDLRGNGGGIVEQAVKVAEKFLPAGEMIVSQRGRTVADSREWRSTNLSPETLPLVLLVDESTASASEIVAGALQDSDRALIVGEKTFGKGLVQNVIDLPQKSGLTLTAARYYTPSGRSIQRDYSEIGEYDYFNHRRPAAAIDKPYFEARTVTGRRVFGGDGILPDENVPAGRLTATQSELLDPIFYFAREVVNGRIEGLGSYRTAELLSSRRVRSDLQFNDYLSAAFRNYVADNAWNFDNKTLVTEAAFIKRRLNYNIIMSLFGSVSAEQVLAEDDAQVLKAVETLPRAAQLTQTAAKIRQRQK